MMDVGRGFGSKVRNGTNCHNNNNNVKEVWRTEKGMFFSYDCVVQTKSFPNIEVEVITLKELDSDMHADYDKVNTILRAETKYERECGCYITPGCRHDREQSEVMADNFAELLASQAEHSDETTSESDSDNDEPVNTNNSRGCRNAFQLFEEGMVANSTPMNGYHANTKNPLRCDTCHKTFCDKSTLKRHNDQVHLGLKPFTCNICNKGYKSLHSLKAHQKNCNGLIVYDDNNAHNKMLQKNASIRKHEESEDETANDSMFINNACALRRIDLYRDRLINTMRVKKFSCDSCTKKFMYMSDLKQHMKLHKKELKTKRTRFACNLCDKEFSSKSYAEFHQSQYCENRVINISDSDSADNTAEPTNEPKKVIRPDEIDIVITPMQVNIKPCKTNGANGYKTCENDNFIKPCGMDEPSDIIKPRGMGESTEPCDTGIASRTNVNESIHDLIRDINNILPVLTTESSQTEEYTELVKVQESATICEDDHAMKTVIQSILNEGSLLDEIDKFKSTDSNVVCDDITSIETDEATIPYETDSTIPYENNDISSDKTKRAPPNDPGKPNGCHSKQVDKTVQAKEPSQLNEIDTTVPHGGVYVQVKRKYDNTCNMCSKKFKTKGYVEIHQSKHCGKRIKTIDTSMHCESNHNESKINESNEAIKTTSIGSILCTGEVTKSAEIKEGFDARNEEPMETNLSIHLESNDHVNKPTDDRFNKPIDNGVEKPVEDCVAKPVSDCLDKPVDDRVDKPIDGCVDKPVAVDDPVDKPVDDYVEKPADDCVDKPVDNCVAKPINDCVDKAINGHVDKPAELNASVRPERRRSIRYMNNLKGIQFESDNLISDVEVEEDQRISCKFCNKEFKTHWYINLHQSKYCEKRNNNADGSSHVVSNDEAAIPDKSNIAIEPNELNEIETFIKPVEKGKDINENRTNLKTDRVKRKVKSKETKRDLMEAETHVMLCDVKVGVSQRLVVITVRENLKEGEMHSCEVCNRTFNVLVERDYHLTRKHGILNYGCERCGKRFTSKSNYRTHVKLKCKKKVSQAMVSSTLQMPVDIKLGPVVNIHEKKEFDFNCDFCGRKFGRLASKNRHMNSKHATKKYSGKLQNKRLMKKKKEYSKKPSRMTSIVPRRSNHQKGSGTRGDFVMNIGAVISPGSVCENKPKSKLKPKKQLNHNDEERSMIDGLEIKSKVYNCDVCSCTFGSMSKRDRHLIVKHGIKKYSCKLCDKQFSQLSYSKFHAKICKKKATHTCTSNKKPVVSKTSVGTPKMVKGVKKFDCEHCDLKFTSLHNRDYHSYRKHQIKRYCCTICGKKYSRKRDLDEGKCRGTFKCHQRAASAVQNSKVTLQESLNASIVENTTVFSDKGRRAFRCDYCDLKFGVLADCDNHVYRIHGVKKYSCVICNRRFVLKGKLKRHASTPICKKNSLDTKGSSQRRNRGTVEGIYLNPTKKSKQSTSRKNHESNNADLNTGKEIDAWGICNMKETSTKLNKRKFKSDEKLNRKKVNCQDVAEISALLSGSMQTEDEPTKIKPKEYSCYKCAKEFTKRSQLNQHMIMHTNNSRQSIPSRTRASLARLSSNANPDPNVDSNSESAKVPNVDTDSESAKVPNVDTNSESAKLQDVDTDSDSAKVPNGTNSGCAKAPDVDTDSESARVPNVDTDSESAKLRGVDTDSESARVPNVDTDSESAKLPDVNTDSESARVPNVDTDSESAKVPSVGTDLDSPKVPNFDNDSKSAKVPSVDNDSNSAKVPNVDNDSKSSKVSSIDNDPESNKGLNEAVGYSCHLCPQKYPSEMHLHKHLRGHKGIMFPCTYCKKEFTRRDHVTRHQRKSCKMHKL